MENYQIKLSNMAKIHHSSSDADGKKKVETFVEEEEDAAGFGEDFFKKRIRLLPCSLLLSGILSFPQVLSISHLSCLILSFQIEFSHSFLIREFKEQGDSSDDEKREGQKSEVVLVSISVLS